jgi:diguanylate cyclase (GGDEF)-like protein/PAS domain S-box-containing protein
MEMSMASDADLRAVLAAHPNAVVAAIATDGRACPVPESIPLGDHHRFNGTLDLLVPDDRIGMIEVWQRAQVEPVVQTEVHLLADPDRAARLHIFDLRVEHGVHLMLLEDHDLESLERSSEAREALRRGRATAKKDGIAIFLDVDDGITTMLGWQPSELIGHQTVEFVHPDDVDVAVGNWMEMRNEGVTRRNRVRMRNKSGQWIWVEVTNENHLDEAEPHVLCHMIDISEEMAHLEALQQREHLLARLAEALPIGICHLRNDREVAYTNEPLMALVGPITSLTDLVERVAPLDRVALELALDNAFDGRPGHVEIALNVDGDERRCEMTIRPLHDDDTLDGVIVCAADVTDRSRMRAELEHRASHDALTGCLNRAATSAAIERLLRDGRGFALAFIDLDGFKRINDEFGHAAGDEILRVAAARLRGSIRPEDSLGRIGGDEFVVICVSDAPFAPESLAVRLRDALAGDVAFARQQIPLHASVGATSSQGAGLDSEALLQRADSAMYAMKRRSRAGIRAVEAV